MVCETVKPKTEIMVSSSPHPFKDANQFDYVIEGTSLLDILKRVQPDKVLRSQAYIQINDEYVDESLWSTICPVEGDFVYISVIPGKGGGGKSPLKTISSIAVIALAAKFGGPLGVKLLGTKLAATAIGSTTLGLVVGKAVIGGVGLLAINALSPPARATSPNLPSLSNTQDAGSPTLFIEGASNAARPYATIPVILGTHKHVPPLGGNTYTEILGNDQYLRMLVVWGYGRLKIEDIKIGNTPIAEFAGVEIETREGVAGDAAVTLFPAAVVEDTFSIELTFANSWQQRTTALNTDEISVDWIFARGLTQFNNDGTVSHIRVIHEVEYRAVGDITWLTPSFTAHTMPTANITGSAVGVVDATTKAVRASVRWAVTRGQYEVRLRRTTADISASDHFEEATWTTLRSFNNDPLITFPHPLAITAITIKATDQLNGVIDNLNATVSSYVQDFGGSSWAEAVSSNPASLFRHVLQSPAYIKNVVDSRIDLDALEAFHTYCVDNGFEFNMIRDFKASVWDTLSDICAVARAVPVDSDGKWSVVIDQAKTVPVQKFTPRNSSAFQAEKIFPDIPHGFKMRFPNRDKEWQQDELIVYDDGFTIANATEFEHLDGIGITDKDHAWKHGRFHLAGIRLRPERYTFNADFEHIIARKGDLILIAHDVLLVGLATGRITAIQTDSSGDVIGISVDENFTMEVAKSYGVSIRTVGDIGIVKTIVLDVGDQTTIVFDTVIASASAPIVGDLVSFGLSGSETLDCLLLALESHSELSAQIIAIPYSAAVFTADTGVIPAFDSKLTALATLPEVDIQSVRSDESVLVRGGGDTLIPRISIKFTPVANRFDATINASIKISGSESTFAPAVIDYESNTEIIISDVLQGLTYDIKLKWRSNNFIVQGDDSFSNGVYVIGQLNPPNPLVNITLSSFGGHAYIRWDLPTDLDVRFGGTVKFRHSPETSSANASWSESVGIGDISKGSDLIATLPLKTGTYLARVFDKGGRASTVVAIDTKQASLLAFAAGSNITEETTFLGIHTNTIAIDGVLKLVGADNMDDWTDVDTIVAWDSKGGVVSAGTYDFAAGHDQGSVKKARITTDIAMTVTNVVDLIDGRSTSINSWESFDGDVSGEADARVQVRVTDDDPATSSASFSAWNNVDSSEHINRGFDYRVNLTSSNSSFSPIVSKLQVNLEEPS
jgi:hypothetical protein